jgi:multidrug resistance protein MdtO
MPLTSTRNTLWDIARLLAPRPGQLELANRLALICALTVLIAEIYQTPEPALTVYVAFFLNRDNRTMSLIIDLVFVALITLIVGFTMLVAMAVINDPMWRVISMAAISFALLFVASASKLGPIGGIIALITGYALDILGTLQQIGELGTRTLLYAWLFVGIPAGVSMVVNLLLAPAPRRLAERAIAQGLDLAAAVLQRPDERIRGEFRKSLREATAQIQEWLGLADREKTSPPGDIAALRQAADSTVALMSAIDVIDRKPEAQLTVPLREYLVRTLHEMAAILRAGGYPIGVAWQPPDPDRPLTPLEVAVLADIRDAIARFAEPPHMAARSDEKPKVWGGFFKLDALSNPDYVYYAVKTTAAAMFCYLLYSLLDWRGIHTVFITCYIVSLGTTAETVEKLTLRILGCLVGAAAGSGVIIFLLPALTSIGQLMAVVFIGTLAAGYVAAGSPRISYAGFQIAFAFLLCVVQGSAPAFDLTIARDRVIGILIGNLVVYLLFTNLWPVSVGTRIDPALAALLQRLSAMMRAADVSARRALASAAQSQLAEIETNIDLAAYEPAAVRPSATWLAARRLAADEIGALGSPLLLSADSEARTSAKIAERLETLAGRFAQSETQTPTPSTDQQVEWSTSPLFPIIDTGLRRLEEAPI